jgi:hypothetical protein
VRPAGAYAKTIYKEQNHRRLTKISHTHKL